MKRIILFIKKFFAWILSFFFDRNKTNKNNKKVVSKSILKKNKKANTKKVMFINRDEDKGESHIIDIYPYTEAKDLKSIDELIDKLKDNVKKINDENEEKE